MEYRVELDVYNGPLDLLLYLIKKDELDIYDIPIARITESYMQYVSVLKEMSGSGLDINVAGDFLVMAATLMEIKSAVLLPKAPAEVSGGETSAAQDLADPRYELVQKLLEYKRFKDNAMALEKRANDIIRTLSGDAEARRRNMITAPSINERIGYVVGAQRMSTSRPTQTQANQYAAAAQDFETVLGQLRQLIETDLSRLEKQLEAAGAPWTPGRIPEWRDQ